MKYECETCACSFVRKQHYDRHLTSTKHKRRVTSGSTMLQCKDCKKTFTYASGLSKHKHMCKYEAKETTTKNLEHENDILKKERDSLKEELKQLKAEKSVTNTTNNNNINNTNIETQNITINLNAHGCENLDYLGKADLIDSIHHVFKSVPNLISKIYFNPEHPENHNVKITDRRSPYISVYTKEKKWKFFNKRDTVGNMIDTSLMMLDDTFMDNKSCLPVPVRDGFARLQKAYEKNDNKTMKNINKEVDMVIMNGPN
jgi:hypothetical protein